jgi:hypothetical protein
MVQLLAAQVYIEQGVGTPQHQAPTVSVYGPGASNKKIPLNRIKGSAFLNDEWQLASLFDKDGKRISAVPGRMNLATNQFHFMWKEQELVAADDKKIALIIFHTNDDSSAIGSIFIKDIPNLVHNKKPLTHFVQAMNMGKCQLLKYTNRQVFPAEDSLFGTQKRYVFKDINFYFIKTAEKVEKIKKLNDEFVLALIPEASSFKEWIKQNNLNLKKEEDIILFLNHYNAQPNIPR